MRWTTAFSTEDWSNIWMYRINILTKLAHKPKFRKLLFVEEIEFEISERFYRFLEECKCYTFATETLIEWRTFSSWINIQFQEKVSFALSKVVICIASQRVYLHSNKFFKLNSWISNIKPHRSMNDFELIVSKIRVFKWNRLFQRKLFIIILSYTYAGCSYLNHCRMLHCQPLICYWMLK